MLFKATTYCLDNPWKMVSYDQLNRLTAMQPLTGLDTASNQWNAIAINNYKENLGYDANGNILKYVRYGHNGNIMDNLTYLYNSKSNQLNQITDKIAANKFQGDIDNQNPNNYLYDKTGNLTRDDPFGMMMQGRSFSSGGYRYGFNGKENDNEVKGVGNQQDYGMRFYDPRVGRFLSVDPKYTKFSAWSSYVFVITNPIMLVDEDGQEPIKPQAGTAAGFVNTINRTGTRLGLKTGQAAHSAMLALGKTEWSFNNLRPMPANTGRINNFNDKYIYTEKGRWIDMAHFMFYAGKAYEYKLQKEVAQETIDKLSVDPRSAVRIGVATREAAKMNPVSKAIQSGYQQEMSDRIFAKHSAYSYEDLPSDRFGAEFGANYFNPNSKLSFGQQLQNYLNTLGATDPQKTPNYSSLPETEPDEKPSRTNHSTTPVFTKENP